MTKTDTVLGRKERCEFGVYHNLWDGYFMCDAFHTGDCMSFLKANTVKWKAQTVYGRIYYIFLWRLLEGNEGA